MLALRFYGKEDLRLEDIPKPECPEEGLLIKVEACAICGSDVRNYFTGKTGHGEMRLPVIMGHELTGKIVEIGKRIENDFRKGELVAIQPAIPCNKCFYCLKGYQNLCENKTSISYVYDGGFAEYMAVPPQALKSGCVVTLPPNASPISCSIAEPLGCAINGQELSNVGMRDTVVIIGGGPLGIMHGMIAKLRGAKKVILSEISKNRAKLDEKFKEIDLLITSNLIERVLEETNGRGADIVIIACPSGKAQQEAFKIIAKRGRINFFGGLPRGDSKITIDSNIIHYKEVFVHGTSDSTPYQFREAIDLIVKGEIDADSLISKVLPLSEFKKALNLIKEGNALKIVFKP
jgi:L-iditol 2-dehydrogenase